MNEIIIARWVIHDTNERERKRERERVRREREKERGGLLPAITMLRATYTTTNVNHKCSLYLILSPFLFHLFLSIFFFFGLFCFRFFQILEAEGKRERERERRQPPMLICIRPTDWLADDDITQLQPSQYYNKLIHCYEFIFHTRFGQYYWSDLGVTSVRPKSVCFDVMRLKKNRQYKVIQFMRLIQLWLHSHTHTHTYTLYKNI